MAKLDSALLSVIPEGEYKLKVKDEPQKQPNMFGSGYFWKFNFYAKDRKGNHFEVSQVFTRKKESYHELLKVLGGTTGMDGVTIPPSLDTEELTGKEFVGTVIQRQAKNDKNRTINEIIHIRPILEKVERSTELEEQEEVDEPAKAVDEGEGETPF